jgi:CubicO group peptidase (beta-lactamase class C family)
MKILFAALLILPTFAMGKPIAIQKEEKRKFLDTRYTVAPPWTIEDKSDHQIFTLPEGDLVMINMILPAVGKPEDLLLKAWKKYQPDFKRKIELKTSPPPAGGWEEIQKITYEVSVKESRAVVGQYAVLKGKAYITLLDGAYATLDKRGAQLALVAGSWKPIGLIEEKLGERVAIKLGPKELKVLENFLQNAIREMMVPGAQVAIVQDGQVVWEKAFGQQQKGRTDKVTADTLFMIGSTTKPLTTLLQARLVDQGKLAWDKPLREILPSFALADPEANRKLELRHTACACTGMPRRDLDFIFEYEGITAEERIAQLKTMSPTTGFGETFQYSNLLVAAGGYAAAHTLYPKLTYDSAYEKALREEVFGPLGFTHSRVHPFAGDRLASPHAIDLQGRMTPIPQRMDDMVYAVAPAGAVWSTARDLSRYVLFELGDGKLDGKQILSEKQVLTRRTPGVKIDDTAKYGLGLITDDVKGLETWGHGGNTLGFTSDLVFLPKQQVGWVLLLNAGGSSLRKVFQQKMLEVLFNAEVASQKNLSHSMNRLRESLSKVRKQISTNPTKNKWIKELVGKWSSVDLGPMVISLSKKGFVADMGEWQSELGTLNDAENTFIFTSPPLAGSVPFQLQKDGSILVDAGQMKYAFKKVP